MKIKPLGFTTIAIVMLILIANSVFAITPSKGTIQSLKISTIKTYGYSGDDHGEAIQVTSNRIIMGGYWNDSAGVRYATILSTDFYGNVIWQKIWKNASYGRVLDMSLDNLGNIYCAYEAGPDSIIKFSPDGNVLFWKNLTIIGKNVWTVCIHNDSLFAGGSNGTDAWIAEYDLNGTMLWEKNFNTGGKDEHFVESAVSYNNASVIMAGNSGPIAPGPADALLVAFSTIDGKELWNKTWGTPSQRDTALGIGLDKNNNIYTTGLESTYTFLRSYTISGSFNWEKQWTGSMDNFGNSILLNNSTVYIGGQSSPKAMILAYDTSSSFLGSDMLSSYALSQIWDISKAKNGTIYATGSIGNGTNLDLALFMIIPINVPEFTTIFIPISISIAIFIIILRRRKCDR